VIYDKMAPADQPVTSELESRTNGGISVAPTSKPVRSPISRLPRCNNEREISFIFSRLAVGAYFLCSRGFDANRISRREVV
jgi:hypothetical protein